MCPNSLRTALALGMLARYAVGMVVLEATATCRLQCSAGVVLTVHQARLLQMEVSFWEQPWGQQALPALELHMCQAQWFTPSLSLPFALSPSLSLSTSLSVLLLSFPSCSLHASISVAASNSGTNHLHGDVGGQALHKRPRERCCASAWVSEPFQ